MNSQYQLMHHEMLQDIGRCMALPHPEKQNAENCFWIAYDYWEKLKGLRKDYVFKSEVEEIEFFREVKPAFTSYMEYFILLSESLLFVPAARQEAITYWQGEADRFERYCNRNRDFVEYYETGCRQQDRNYFLRKSATELKYVPIAPIYDGDAAFCTSHDQLVRGYMAYKRYHEYVEKKLEVLEFSK